MMHDRVVTITPERGVEQTVAQRFAATRPLLRQWIARELRVRYRQSTLRAAWSLIQPITILVTYGWVLNRVLQVGSENVPYLTFAWAGIVPYTFIQQSLAQGTGAIQQSGALISRVYFPREVLPLSVVGCSLVDLGVMTAILIVVSWVQVGAPTVHLVAIVLVDLVLLAWTTGLTVLAATVTVFRRDLVHAMPVVLRVLFIVSPVMYAASLLAWAARLNPLAVVIEATRDVVIRGRWPDLPLLGSHLAIAVTLVLIAFAQLRRLEPRMGDFV